MAEFKETKICLFGNIIYGQDHILLFSGGLALFLDNIQLFFCRPCSDCFRIPIDWFSFFYPILVLAAVILVRWAAFYCAFIHLLAGYWNLKDSTNASVFCTNAAKPSMTCIIFSFKSFCPKQTVLKLQKIFNDSPNETRQLKHSSSSPFPSSLG